MHIKKNICANIISTLLNIPDKTKDTVKATLDLVEMRICEQLQHIRGDKIHIYRQHAILCLEMRR